MSNATKILNTFAGLSLTAFTAKSWQDNRRGDYGHANFTVLSNENETYKVHIKKGFFTTKVTTEVYNTSIYNAYMKSGFEYNREDLTTLAKRTETERFIRPVKITTNNYPIYEDDGFHTYFVFGQEPDKTW